MKIKSLIFGMFFSSPGAHLEVIFIFLGNNLHQKNWSSLNLKVGCRCICYQRFPQHCINCQAHSEVTQV
jgi:hypothetical protein